MIDAHERLAIHLRDDFTCQWCAREILVESRLTVDTLERTPEGDVAPEGERFTVCGTCERWRSSRPASEFAADVGKTLETEPAEILDRIARRVTLHMGRHRAASRTRLAEYGSIGNFFDKGLADRRSDEIWDSFAVMRYQHRIDERLAARLGFEALRAEVETTGDGRSA